MDTFLCLSPTCLMLPLLLLLHHTIAADPYLLLANRPLILRMSLDGSDSRLLHGTDPSNNSWLGLDVDTRTGEIFLSDSGKPKSILIGDEDSLSILEENVTDIDSVAWDWVNRKLYWADKARKTIEVMDIETGYRKVLLRFENTTTSPRMLILDPVRGYIFWTSWTERATGSKLVCTSMDGTESNTIYRNEGISRPNAITIDHDTQTLYFIDAFSNRIASLSTDGSSLTFLQNLTNATVPAAYQFSMDFFQGKLYWSDWIADGVFSYSVGDPQGSVQLVRDVEDRDPASIKVVDTSRQPLPKTTNPCSISNGGCSHLCLLSASQSRGYSCACPDGVNPRECSELPTSDPRAIVGNCMESPCLNSGVCVDQPYGKVICNCPIGFEGLTCTASCSENPCLNGGACREQNGGRINCSCLAGTQGFLCSEQMGPATSTDALQPATELFAVSGVVFLAVTLSLVGVILILVLTVTFLVFTSLRAKYSGNRSTRNSIAGMTDSSPRDSPTHVVVGRLSDHDYISIKSRESPAPRGIVINIENLGGRCTPNQYTIHKQHHSSSLPSHLVTHNNRRRVSTPDTLPLPNGHASGTISTNISSDSENEYDYNGMEPRVDEV